MENKLTFKVARLSHNDYEISENPDEIIEDFKERYNEMRANGEPIPELNDILTEKVGYAKVYTDFEECFNRANLLEKINQDFGTEYKSFNEIMEETDATFCCLVNHDNETNQLELRIVTESNDCGWREDKVPLIDEERTELNDVITEYYQHMMNLYDKEYKEATIEEHDIDN